jgi:3-methyladenine DNA glycosylase AlkD
MATIDDVLAQLHALASPDNVAGMARFGIVGGLRLGIAMPELRRIAKAAGRDHALALALWSTGIPEARIVASLVDDPRAVAEPQMERWVVDFDSWDVCDQVCMNLFDKTPLAWQKVRDWAKRDEEFVKRAAFALLASIAWHDKTAGDQHFIQALPLIVGAATDPRNYVKKAVSWALRTIGKRNAQLNQAAIQTAQELAQLDSQAARWVARDAQRELAGDAVQKRLGQVTR